MSLPVQGPLAPITRERLEDRQAHRVPTCWVREAQERPLPSTAILSRVDAPGAPRPELPAVTEEPVLFMLAERPPAVALSALLQAVDRGHRVYVLATQGFGEGQRDPGLRDRVKGRALVRRVPELPASALLWDRGRAGEAWLGPSAGVEALWRLSLSPSQSAAWFQVFLQLFWHEAIDEAFTAPGGLRFQPAAARPFDVPTSSGDVQLVGSGVALECPTGTTVYLPSGAPPSGSPARVVFPASGQHQPSLANLVKGGAAVSWRDTGLPPTVLGVNSALMALRGATRTLHLRLQDDQCAALSAVFDSVVAAPSWRFRIDTALAELPEQPVWLAEEGAAKPPMSRVELSAPPAQASEIHAMDQADPPSWPPAPALARLTRTTWQVLPPCPPKGSVEDQLIASWHALDADVARRARLVREALSETERHQSRIGAAFQALVGPLLGFGRKRSALLQELGEHFGAPTSAGGPEKARIALQHLERIESEAARLSDDLGETERKAHEDAERRRQEATHEKATREARQQLTERRGEQKNKRSRQEELTRMLAELDAEKAEDKSKDREATRRRWGDELSAVQRRIKTLDAEIPELEQRAAEPFVFKPPAAPPRPGGKTTGANSFVPKASARSIDPVPAEALPVVGELLRQGGQRYLVVRRWEDLAQATQEGHRLGAKLVGPLEGS